MSTPKERPILMSAAMVKALLDGRKTQTRRIAKLPIWFGGCPPARVIDGVLHRFGCQTSDDDIPCPYGQISDHLWVKENFRLWDYDIETICVEFEAGGDDLLVLKAKFGEAKRLHEKGRNGRKLLRPSIFMKRCASRLTLKIVNVRVERVQDISGEDCLSEGVRIPVSTDGKLLVRLSGDYKPADYVKKHPRDWTPTEALRAEYASLWDSLNAKRGYGWDKNPFVWVLEFKRL